MINDQTKLDTGTPQWSPQHVFSVRSRNSPVARAIQLREPDNGRHAGYSIWQPHHTRPTFQIITGKKRNHVQLFIFALRLPAKCRNQRQDHGCNDRHRETRHNSQSGFGIIITLTVAYHSHIKTHQETSFPPDQPADARSGSSRTPNHGSDILEEGAFPILM